MVYHQIRLLGPGGSGVPAVLALVHVDRRGPTRPRLDFNRVIFDSFWPHWLLKSNLAEIENSRFENSQKFETKCLEFRKSPQLAQCGLVPKMA